LQGKPVTIVKGGWGENGEPTRKGKNLSGLLRKALASSTAAWMGKTWSRLKDGKTKACVGGGLGGGRGETKKKRRGGEKEKV